MHLKTPLRTIPVRRYPSRFILASLLLLAACGDRYQPVVEGISFNFNPASSVGDAINIRSNAREVVNIPEWQLGEGSAAQSPVVYSQEHVRQGPVSVRVRINLLPPREGRTAEIPSQVEFRADGGGMLGALYPQTVNFSAGNLAVDVTFPLNNHTLATGGYNGVKRATVEWQWKYRLPGQSEWTNIQLSRHMVFTLPREPQSPWVQQPFPSDQNPWLSALMFATQMVSTAGTNREGADPYAELSAAIAKYLNPQNSDGSNPVRLRYTITPGNYAGDSRFNLTSFLQRVNGGEGGGANVDCSDCTAIMVAMANIVGCPLYARRINGGEINPVKPIGLPNWWMVGDIVVPDRSSSPVRGDLLAYHEVATLQTTSEVRVFDICYRTNSLASPTGSETPDLLNRSEAREYPQVFRRTGMLDYQESLAYPVGANVRNMVFTEYMNRTVF